MDYSALDTTPGSRSILAHPSDWSGDYREWLRSEYQRTSFIKEAALASYRYTVTISGPHAETAAEALRAIRGQAAWQRKPYAIQSEEQR